MLKLNHFDIIDHIAKDLRASDFHAGRGVEDDWHYKAEAEAKINAMTNVELMELLCAEIERQNS